jgi:hypothetical protein
MLIQEQTANDATPQTFYCFVDRDAARMPDFFLPNSPGVLVMETDFIGTDLPKGWTLVDTNRGKSHDGKLEVAKLGEYWFIGRRREDWDAVSETVVEAFGQVPICTRTCCDAMLLAEHCHPEVNLPVGAHWIGFEI